MRSEAVKVQTAGLVVKEQNVGESDRLITILTAKYGLIRAFVHRAKNVKSNLVSSTQLLCYSDFTLYQGKTAYTVGSARVKNVFFGLREDIEALSAAMYLTELFGNLAPENSDAEDLLRLLLNSLYLLAEHKKPVKQIKAVAELRGLSDAGYMPDLVACRDCGAFETPRMVFNPVTGSLRCEDCGAGAQGLLLSLSAVTAMRHIIYSDAPKVFQFALSDAALPELSMAAEQYALQQTGRTYKTLDFYHSLPES